MHSFEIRKRTVMQTCEPKGPKALTVCSTRSLRYDYSVIMKGLQHVARERRNQ